MLDTESVMDPVADDTSDTSTTSAILGASFN